MNLYVCIYLSTYSWSYGPMAVSMYSPHNCSQGGHSRSQLTRLARYLACGYYTRTLLVLSSIGVRSQITGIQGLVKIPERVLISLMQCFPSYKTSREQKHCQKTSALEPQLNLTRYLVDPTYSEQQTGCTWRYPCILGTADGLTSVENPLTHTTTLNRNPETETTNPYPKALNTNPRRLTPTPARPD